MGIKKVKRAIERMALVVSVLLGVPEAVGVETAVVVVVGAPGEEAYGEMFEEAEATIAARCEEAGVVYHVIGRGEGEGADRERLASLLKELASNEEEGSELWVILLGHGTFDGRAAKFNTRGADFSATELKEWLKAKKEGVVLVNTSSSSAPFLSRLSGPGRVIITATKSGDEVFLTRFGGQFAEALANPEADLDADGQVSLLETFLTASRGVADYYAERGLLATEHSLLDDNGDGKGTPPDWFTGVRVAKKAKDEASPDGLRAHQVHLKPSEDELALPADLRARRNELELQVLQLRYAKDEMEEDVYYRSLERIFVEMAGIYERAGDKKEKVRRALK
jgi:hypothetical protein